MKLTIKLTQSWTVEQFEPYMDDLVLALQDYATGSHSEITFKEIVCALTTGKNQLWLILDESEKFKAFLTTSIEIIKNGEKRLRLLDLCGKGGVQLADLILAIENWARKNEIAEICFTARTGWAKRLKSHGYNKLSINFKKELNYG